MSNTMPKYEGNLNCISYGSNILIKLDSVDLLRIQFEKFESHFRKNEHVIYDEKIPRFVIETFSKLWKLWVDFPELQDVIHRNLFYEVFKDMASVFETKQGRPEETTGVDECVTLAKVETTRRPATKHYMLLDEVQGYGDGPPESKKPFVVPYPDFTSDHLNKTTTTSVSLGSDSQANQQIKSEQWGWRNSSDSSQSSDAVEDVNPKHHSTMSRMDVSNSNDESIVEITTLLKEPTKEDPHCGPCCRSIDVHKSSIKKHLQSVGHLKHIQLMINCLDLLKTNEGAIFLLNELTMQFVCIPCQMTQKGINCLIQHCSSKKHLNSVLKKPVTHSSFSNPSSISSNTC